MAEIQEWGATAQLVLGGGNPGDLIQALAPARQALDHGAASQSQIFPYLSAFSDAWFAAWSQPCGDIPSMEIGKDYKQMLEGLWLMLRLILSFYRAS